MKREFLFIAEAGLLEQQALLLAESLRTFGGRCAADAITILQPRAERPISPQGRLQFERLGARIVEMAILSPCPEYGTSYRVLACADYERSCAADYLVFLDSDMVVLSEPDVELDDADVAARPVDVKGMCTAGPEDPADAYWRELCRLCAVDDDRLSEVICTVDGARVKACYNGGLTVTRPKNGLFAKTAEFFLASIRAGLVSWPGEPAGFVAGHGEVSAAGAKLWGSSQACLALAIAQLGLRVRILPASQNFPLHSYPELRERIERGEFPPVALLHYHHVLRNPSRDNPLLAGGPLFPAESVHWLRARVGRFTWKGDQRLIVVLGMHRTGTSMLTKGLESLGVDLGSEFHPATPDNPSGFWEDRGFHALNEALLGALGSSWDDLRVLEAGKVLALCEGEFLERALLLVHDCLARGPIVGVKDPRFAVLLPFWNRVFQEAGVPVSYLVSLRNPLSVAASLERRDAMPKQQALWLWALHYISIFAATTQTPVPVVVDYDRMMDDPAGEWERLAALLGLTVNRVALAAYAGNFLQRELRHTRFAAEELTADGECDDLVRSVYEVLARQSGASAWADRAAWNEQVAAWRESLREKTPTLAHVLEIARISRPWREQIVAHRVQLGELEARLQTIPAQAARIVELETEREIIPAQAGRIAELEDAAKIIPQQAARIAELEAQATVIPEQAALIATLETRMETLEARAAKMEARAAIARVKVAALRQRFAELYASPYWRFTKPLRSIFKRWK